MYIEFRVNGILTERVHFIGPVMIIMPFFTSVVVMSEMCDALHYLLDNIFIRFGSEKYRRIVGMKMGTNCTALVADCFCFVKRDVMLSLSDNNQTDIIEDFNSTSRYLDDLLNIDKSYFEQMEGQMYTTEFQLNKANSSDTEAPFLDLNMFITNGIVSF